MVCSLKENLALHFLRVNRLYCSAHTFKILPIGCESTGMWQLIKILWSEMMTDMNYTTMWKIYTTLNCIICTAKPVMRNQPNWYQKHTGVKLPCKGGLRGWSFIGGLLSLIPLSDTSTTLRYGKIPLLTVNWGLNLEQYTDPLWRRAGL